MQSALSRAYCADTELPGSIGQRLRIARRLLELAATSNSDIRARRIVGRATKILDLAGQFVVAEEQAGAIDHDCAGQVWQALSDTSVIAEHWLQTVAPSRR